VDIIGRLINKKIDKIITDSINIDVSNEKESKNKSFSSLEVPSLLEFCSINGFDFVDKAHLDWIAELDNEENLWKPEKVLYLKPRDTYKSTIYTILYPLWRVLKDPSLRVVIGSNQYDNAKSFLGFIRNLIEFKDWYKENGIGEGDIWQSGRFNLNIRPVTTHRDCNFTAIGLNTKLAGMHYDIGVFDDIVHNDDRMSKTTRDKKVQWFQDIPNIMVAKSKTLIVGTRWHFDDLYNHLIKNLEIKNYVETPYNEDGSLRFPSRITPEIIKLKKKDLGPIMFSCQMMNDPLPAETAVFQESMLHFYNRKDVDNHNLKFYGFVDLSMGKTQQSDYTAIVTIATDEEYIYIWDAIVRRQPPSQSIENIIALDNLYNYEVFGGESNAFQELFIEQLEGKLDEAEKDLYVKHVKHTTDKVARISSMQPIINSGIVLFPSDYKNNPNLVLLVDQLLHFGATDHDDAPDALEGAIELSRKYKFIGLA